MNAIKNVQTSSRMLITVAIKETAKQLNPIQSIQCKNIFPALNVTFLYVLLIAFLIAFSYNFSITLHSECIFLQMYSKRF